MSGVHVGCAQYLVRIRLHRAELRDPLRRLPVLHLRVVQPGEHQQARVVLRFDVIVGRIGEDIVEGGALVGVTPLVVFAGRQRDAVVEHRRRDIDERHVCHRAGEQIRAHVDDGTHQQPTSAATQDEQPRRVGESLVDQVFRACNEVAEGIRLVPQAAGVIPPTAELLAPAHVRDGEHEPAVEQTQPRRVERGVHADAIRAVAIQQQRVRPVTCRIDPGDE